MSNAEVNEEFHEAELAALRQQLAEARAEVERLLEERERTVNELHDAADELSCPHVHGIETVDGKAEAVWLGAMVARQLRESAERNGVERGEVSKLLEDNWRLYKQQLAEARAEVEVKNEEIETLRSYHHDAEKAFQKFFESQDTLAAQAAELERLRERCEAAEKIIRSNGMLVIGIVEISDPMCSGSWEVERTDTGDVIGEENEDGEIEAALFDDWFTAYQAAIAAGWLPSSNSKGGE